MNIISFLKWATPIPPSFILLLFHRERATVDDNFIEPRLSGLRKHRDDACVGWYAAAWCITSNNFIKEIIAPLSTFWQLKNIGFICHNALLHFRYVFVVKLWRSDAISSPIMLAIICFVKIDIARKPFHGLLACSAVPLIDERYM